MWHAARQEEEHRCRVTTYTETPGNDDRPEELPEGDRPEELPQGDPAAGDAQTPEVEPGNVRPTRCSL